MSSHYDAIVIGAGHNGLTAAAYLARAGQTVLVLERRNVLGGSLVTEEIAPGFKVDTCVHRGQLAAEVVRDLALGRHGLEPLPGVASLFSPQPDGRGLWLSADPVATRDSLERFSAADAGRWAAFVTLMKRIAGVLREVDALAMPPLPDIPAAELPALGRLALHWRGLGKADMMEVLRVLPMSAAELLNEWFEADALKGVLGALGVQGLLQGPLSAGTAFLMLHQWVNHDGPFKATARGGVGQITAALASAARAAGAQVRTGAEVAHILVRDGRALGVALTGGEEVRARYVVSAADPKRTLLGLVDPAELDPTFAHAVEHVKMRGAWAKVNLALAGLPTFSALSADGAAGLAPLRGVISVGPSLSYLERAYDDAKYGRLSEHPHLEVTVPSLADPTLAPAGQHVMSIWAQYAPYHLKEGEWETKRELLGDRVIETLSEYAPDLKSLILHRQVLTPLDLERTYGLTEGNVYHGEMLLDQILFMRPVPGWAQYRTPIAGLYLCGPGTHPGGGVSGRPGRHAARQVLKDDRLKG